MRYRIDFVGDQKSLAVNSRSDLLKWLKQLHPNMIDDIRKIYSNGVSDSVMDLYEKYMRKLDEA